MKKMINKNKPLILGCLTAALLAACSGVSGNGGSGDNAGVQHPADNMVKEIKIGKSLIMPTADSATGGYQIRVDNNTGESVTLYSFQMSDSNEQGLVTKVIDKGVRLFGGAGYDPRLQDDSRLGSCKDSVPAGGYCTLSFMPNQASGSLGVALNFKSSKAGEKNTYKAARLVEYSNNVSRVGVDNGATKGGFIVGNTKTLHFATKNNYSISIPFVADEDFASIQVNSAITPLLSDNNCVNNVAAGSRCDVVMRMLPGDYDNVITVTGITKNGVSRSFKVNLSATLADEADFEMTGGPLVVGKADGSVETKTITLVNAGSTDVTYNAPQLNQVYADDGGQGLSVSPPNGGTLSAGNVTDLSLTNDGKGSGDMQLAVGYQASNGSGTAAATIYYKGKNGGGGNESGMFDLETAGLDFTNTSTGSIVQGSVTVDNTGNDVLSGIESEITPFVPGLSIDKKSSTCNVDLAPGDKCIVSITYNPGDADSGGFTGLIVKAKDVTNSGATVASRFVNIPYSAVTGPGTYAFSFDQPSITLQAQADGREQKTAIDTLYISGTTDSKFNLTTIKSYAGQYSSHLSKQITFQNQDDSTDVESVTLDSNGAYTGSPAVALKVGHTYNVTYTYGPVVQEESGFLQQRISGTFANRPSSTYDANITINYSATNDGTVVIDGPKVYPGTDTQPLANNESFELVKSNIAKITYTYTMPALPGGIDSIKSFVLNDSELPFGVMADQSSTCPMNSLKDYYNTRSHAVFTPTPGAQCTANYNLMDLQLADPYFYSLVVSNPVPLFQPGYTITYLDNNHVPIHKAHSAGDTSLTVIPTAFTGISATPSKNGHDVYTYAFKLTNFDPQGKLGDSSRVDVTLDTSEIPSTVAIAGGSLSFSLGKDESAPVMFMIPPGTSSFTVPYTFTSRVNPDYNQSKGLLTVDISNVH